MNERPVLSTDVVCAPHLPQVKDQRGLLCPNLADLRLEWSDETDTVTTRQRTRPVNDDLKLVIVSGKGRQLLVPLCHEEDGIRDWSVTEVQTCALLFSSRRRHTRLVSDWSSDVCSSDLFARAFPGFRRRARGRR